MANEAVRIAPTHDDAGKLVLRLVLGLLVLAHGISKVIGGNGFVTGALGKMGLPTEIGYLVYIGEVLAPLLLILGIWSRAAALVIAINMLVAVSLAHTRQLFSLAPTGGYALELQAMYLFGAIAVLLLGAGRYSIGGPEGRWN